MDPYGLPASLLAEACGVSPDTARRWKRQGRIPPLPSRLADLAISGQLGTLGPSWSGFIFGKKEIWTPHGFSVSPGEICAIPYRRAQIRALERELAEPHQWVLVLEEIDRRSL